MPVKRPKISVRSSRTGLRKYIVGDPQKEDLRRVLLRRSLRRIEGNVGGCRMLNNVSSFGQERERSQHPPIFFSFVLSAHRVSTVQNPGNGPV